MLDIVHRVARLAELVPEVAELDINPLIAAPGGALAVDVKLRLPPPPCPHPTRMHAGSVDVLAHGLTAVEAAARLRRDGRNVLPSGHGPSALRQLLAQLTHFFALMLWIAAGLAWLAGLPQLAVAIVIVVLLNGVFAFAQEYRADRATARLGELLPARVRCDVTAAGPGSVPTSWSSVTWCC